MRIVVVYQITWRKIAPSHMTGYRTFRTTDRSTNCWSLAAIGWGEGWTTTITPSRSPRATDCNGTIDVTWITIKFSRRVRLAQDINCPAADARPARLT